MNDILQIEDALEPNIVELELHNEDEAVEKAKARYNALVGTAIEKGKEADLPPQQLMMKKAMPSLIGAIRKFANSKGRVGKHTIARPYLKMLAPESLAVITMAHLMECCNSGLPIQRMAVLLAEEVVKQINYQAFRAAVPALTRLLDDRVKSSNADHRNRVMTTIMNSKIEDGTVEPVEWDEVTCLHVGMTLIQMVVDYTGVFKKARVSSQKRDSIIYTVVLTDDSAEWLEAAHKVAALRMTIKPPMLMRPKDYVDGDLSSGGYLTSFHTKGLALVHTRRKSTKEYLEAHPMPRVVDAVNAIQSVPWKINTRMLDVAKWVQKQGGGVAGVVNINRDVVIPAQPWKTLDMKMKEYKELYPEEHQRYRVTAAQKYSEWHTMTSKRKAFVSCLQRAKDYKERPAIWFPQYLDWRGRIYPYTPNLSPQGDDLSKSLLQFAVGKPLGERGVWWLMVHAANCFGKDKLSFEDRVKWTQENWADIIRCAKDPYGSSFWRQEEQDEKGNWHLAVDDPFKFLAACFELEQVDRLGEKAISHLPIALDGSCNSYQHYSAMLLDEDAGKLVNLIGADKPQDIYMETTREVETLIDRILATSTDEDELEMARAWYGKVDRGICKRGTMTNVYGVTSWGIADQLIDELSKRKGVDGSPYLNTEKLSKAANFMGKLIEDSLTRVVSSATQAMNWLQDTASKVSALNEGMVWTTPAGFPVVQMYNKTRKKRVKLTYGNELLFLTLKEDLDTVDSRSMRQAVAPCYVHSLDAAHLMLTVNKCVQRGVTSFATIHDSCGTHACDTDILSHTLREEFVGIYSRNVLADLAEELSERYQGIDLNPLPATGSLDIASVLDAPYFFA